MSWQAYVDTSLVGSGNLDKAAIFNVEGTSVWAATTGFTVRQLWNDHIERDLAARDEALISVVEGRSRMWRFRLVDDQSQVAPEEIKEVVASYADNGEPKKVQSSGFYVAGHRYVTIKADYRSLYGKKGKEGVVIVKTTQAILVGHYPEVVQPGSAANTVEKLGDYLISSGY